METKVRNWGVVVVMALGLAGAGLWLARGQRQACDGGEGALEGVWDGTRQEALHQAFLATRLPYAESTWRGVHQGLERYTRAWVDMHRDTCEATHVRGTQSLEVLTLRMQCLERRRQELKALTEVLSEEDAQGPAQANRVLERLVPLESCADSAWLVARERLPEETTVRARVEELQGRLAQVHALFLAGRNSQGVQQGIALAEEAEATGFRPLVAEAWLLVARMQYYASNDPRDSVESAHRAARAFLASGQQEGVAQAWLELVTSLQLQGKPAAEEQEKWLRYLEGALVAAGNPPALRADAERRLAYIHSYQGRYEEALEHARKAVALRERPGGPESAGLANALLEQMRAGAFAGQYEEAMAAGQRALAYWKATVGLEHPATLRVLNLMGVLQGMTWHLADSAATYEQLLSIMQRLPGPVGNERVVTLNNLAVTYFQQGRHAEGEPLLAQALALLDERQARGSIHGVICLQSLAESKYLQGQHTEALKLAREALALAEKGVAPQHIVFPAVLTTLGEAELEVGSATRARALLERALELQEAAPGRTRERGHARFALARALEATSGDRARMKTLLEQARADFDEAGAPAGRLRAAWDAWVRSHASL